MSNYLPVILHTEKGPLPAVMNIEEGGGGGGGGLPAGGVAGNVISKNSGTDGDASWKTPDAAGLVAKTGNQNILGTKTFQGIVNFNNALRQTGGPHLVLSTSGFGSSIIDTPSSGNMLVVNALGDGDVGPGTITVVDNPDAQMGQLLYLCYQATASDTISYNIQGGPGGNSFWEANNSQRGICAWAKYGK
jgi:hypothetical protein